MGFWGGPTTCKGRYHFSESSRLERVAPTGCEIASVPRPRSASNHARSVFHITDAPHALALLATLIISDAGNAKMSAI